MMLALLTVLLTRAALAEDRTRTYSNPVLVETYKIKRTKIAPYNGVLGIGDPGVIYHEGRYYLYPTGDNHSYYVYISNDLIHWEKGPRVFYTRERGAWAPDIFFSKADRMFYLYYTVNGRIGVATSERPDGVFKERGRLVSRGIDAHLFKDDDGSFYLYYARYPDFAIFVQSMESPLKKKGEAVLLIYPSEAWEKKDMPVTEAPWIIKHKGVYYLLYSGGSADSENYAIGYATSGGPTGPFTKHGGNPIVRKGDGIFGPGHLSVVSDQVGKLWMVYHQQKDERRGWNRIICIDPIWFDAEGVLHGRATRDTPQPAPVIGNHEGERNTEDDHYFFCRSTGISSCLSK